MGSEIKNIFDVHDGQNIDKEYYVPETNVILVLYKDYNYLTLNIERKISDEDLSMYVAIGQDVDNYADLIYQLRHKFYGQSINATTMHAIGREIQQYFNKHLA